MTPAAAPQTRSDNTAVRPFNVNVPEADLTELRRRINATKWPERETVTDASAWPAIIFLLPNGDLLASFAGCVKRAATG
jgi:hypothetical protein